MIKNRFVTALLSAIVAFGLWVYVITVVSPNSEKVYHKVPVVLSGQSMLLDRNLMVTSETDLTVELKLSGNRTDLDKVDSGNIRLLADMTKIESPGTHDLSLDISWPGNVASDAFTVQYYEPSSISVVIERRVIKKVPVRLDYKGSVAADCIIDKENVTLTDPLGQVLTDGAVTVVGPESVIEQIDHAQIEVDLSDREQTFNEAYRYTLCNAKGEPVDVNMVETNMESVNVLMVIQRVKEIPLKVTVVGGGGATEENSIIEVDPPSIKVCGSDAALENFHEINFGTVDLGTMEQGAEFEHSIILPDGITSLSGETTAKVFVSFPALQVQSFAVTQITPINVPEGLDVDVVTKTLTVKVRGPKELVSKMTAADITVTVDCAGEKLGTFAKKPVITMKPEYASVGTMGTYSVSVTLFEPIVEVIVDDTTGPSVPGE